MFVSAYSTYVSTNTNDKLNKPKFDEQKVQDKPFSKILVSAPALLAYDTKNIPINYISNYKSFNNKQKLLDSEIKSKDEVKFKKMSDVKNAKTSYESNSHMFSLMSVPKAPINQTTRINEVNLDNMKHKMVNTYLENDKYYQLTA